MPQISKKRILKATFYVIAIIAIFTLAFYLAHLARSNENLQDIIQRHGYWGAFVVAVISGFNLAVPIPAASFFPLFLEAGLNFWLVILIITAGMTFSDMIAAALGKTGRHIIKDSVYVEKTLERMERFRKRYHWIPLVILFLFAAFVPIPNEAIVVPLGFMGYKFRYLIPIVFGGNIIFNFLTGLSAAKIFALI